jgi:hypothetical protein
MSKMCPCNYARWGAALGVWGLYLLVYSTKLQAHVQRALHGEFSIEAAAWLAGAAVALVMLAHGIREARTHSDDFELRSFVWSVCVIGLCMYLLLHDHTPLPPPDAARGFVYGVMAGNAVNIWLQLRGIGGGPPGYGEPARPWFRFRRRSIKITEWSTGDDQSSPPLPDVQWEGASSVAKLLHELRRNGATDTTGLPEILPDLYVRQGNRFVPLRLGNADAPHVIEHRR